MKDMGELWTEKAKLLYAVDCIRSAYKLVQSRYSTTSTPVTQLGVEQFIIRLHHLGLPTVCRQTLGYIAHTVMHKITKKIKNGKALDKALEEMIGTDRIICENITYRLQYQAVWKDDGERKRQLEEVEWSTDDGEDNIVLKRMKQEQLL